MSSINNRLVAIVKSISKNYPKNPPFNPSEIFPEYPYPSTDIDPDNIVYSALRESFYLLNFDKKNYNQKWWNPLGNLIKPGNTVFIKPNFIQDYHHDGADLFSVITHGSVIRAVIDYVVIALKNQGTIIVADAPVVSASYDKILKLTNLKDIISHCRKYSKIGFEYFDLRKEMATLKDHLIVERSLLQGDPKGYVPIDLGSNSEFQEISCHFKKYRGSDYDMEETIKHHNLIRNEYLLSKSALEADVVIHIPKLKTHQKSGVTLNLKGIIGLNGDKNWIPHFRVGNPSNNGDEFPHKNLLRLFQSRFEDRIKQRVYNANKLGLFIAGKLRRIQKSFIKHFKKTGIRSGAWSGNDTLWRSVLDLNKILLYADNQGNMNKTPQRNIFSIVDGIIAGDGNGPISPRVRLEGILIAGSNWLAVDICATRLMGFDYNRIPMFEKAFKLERYMLMDFDPTEIEIHSNIQNLRNVITDKQDRFLNFQPAPGWLASL